MQDYFLTKFLTISKAKYFRQNIQIKIPTPELEPEPTVFTTPKPTKEQTNKSSSKLYLN